MPRKTECDGLARVDATNPQVGNFLLENESTIWNTNMRKDANLNVVSGWVRLGMAGVLVALGTNVLAQERPAMTIRQGQLVTPDASRTLYPTTANRTFSVPSLQTAFNANTRPVQVRELARGLGSGTISPGAVGAGQISQEEYANRAF